MKFSAKIVLRQPARQDGTCQVRLQIVINRKPAPIGLGIGWPAALFDEDNGLCLASQPRKKRRPGYEAALAQAVAWAGGTEELLAQKASDYNLIIGKALAKANEVFVNFRLSGQVLTLESFLLDFNSEGSKKDFVVYYRQKVAERYRKGLIKEGTRKNHLSTLNALATFQASIPFYSLTTQFADDFHAYLKRHVKSTNTRWTRHRDVKTYLGLARKDRIKFEDPYEHFQNQSVPGQWKPLRPMELQRLEQFYQQCEPGKPFRRVLQRFLFSCFSSLRLGDLKAIQHAKIEGQEMVFKIQKTYEKKQRDMMLPLTKRAVSYLADARAENGMEGFFNYTDQYSNRVLKAIGRQLDIETNLHHHVGRETFATEFVRHGGKIEVLQKLLDHEKITTTMKYAQVDDDMKREAIRALDEHHDNSSPLMKVS